MAELPKNTQSTNLQQLASRRRRVAAQAAAVRELQAQYDSLDPEEASESLRNSMENKEWWTAKDLGKSVVGGMYNAGLSLHNLGMATFGKGHRAFPQESFYEPETIGGGAVSGMSQWATGFLGSLGTVKGVKALTKKKLEKEVKEGTKASVPLTSRAGSSAVSARTWSQILLQGAGYGAVSDFISFDPSQGNLGTFLKDKADAEGWKESNPDFYNFISDWVAIDPEEFVKNERTIMAEYTTRLKNVGEGVVLGAGVNGAMRLLKVGKIHFTLGRRRTALEKAEKDLLEFQEGMQSQGVSNKGIMSTGEFKRLSAKLKESQNAYKKAVDDGVDALADVEKDLNILKDADDEITSGFGGIDSSLIRQPVGDSGVELKANYTDIDFSKSKVAERRTHLYSVDKKEGTVGLDVAAIEKDFLSEEPFPYLNGRATELRTGNRSKISTKELNVMTRVGVDPARLKSAIIAKYGAGEEGLEAYKQFYVNRAKLVLEYAKEAGIPNDKLFMGSATTDKVYAKATYHALFDKGKLALAPEDVKHSYAGELTPEGVLTDPAVMAKEVLGEGFDLPAFLRSLESAKAANPSKRGMTLSQLAEKGDMFNVQTFTSAAETRKVMAAVMANNERFFKQTFATYDDLATASGWTGSGSPQEFIVEDIRSFLKVLASDTDTAAFHKKLEQDFIEAEGIFEGTGVSSLPTKSLDQMPPRELSAMAGRIFSLRSRINSRLRHLDERATEWKKLSDEGELTEDDMMEFVLSKYGFLRDITEIRTSARATGKALAAFRSYDELLAQIENAKRLNDPEQIERIRKELIRSAGGADKVRGLIEIQAQQAKEQPFAWMANDKALESIKAFDRLEQASWLDLGPAFNDIMINSMLSGFRTHSVNFTSNIIKAVANLGEEYLGSFAPANLRFGAGFGKGVDEQGLTVLGDELSGEAARAFARGSAKDQMIYTLQNAYDVLRLYFKHAEDDAIIVDPKAAARTEEAIKQRDFAYDSDIDTSQTLGNRSDFVDPRGHGRGSATSEKIGNAFEDLAQSLPLVGGPTTRNTVSYLRNTSPVQALGTVWDGFYQHFIRQATRKMNLADQMAKRIHYGAKIKATLINHGRHYHGIPEDSLGEWVETRMKDMVLPNGTVFSEKNLKIHIYDTLKSEIDPATKEPRWTGKALTEKARRMFEFMKDVRDPDTGEVILTLKQREELASRGTQYADEATFTTDLQTDAQSIRDAQIAEQNARVERTGVEERRLSARAPKGLSKEAADKAKESALFRLVVPFVQTPVNLWRDTIVHMPVLGTLHKKHRADMMSQDPSRRAKAAGRQAVGIGLWGTAYSLTIGNRMSGGLSRDHRERAVQKGAGQVPYSATLPNGYKVDFSRLEPFAWPYKIMGDFNELARYARAGDDTLALQAYGDVALQGITSAATSSTWLKGVSELAVGISQVAAAKDADASDAIVAALEQRLTAVIPNIMRDLGPAGFDPVQRDLHDLQSKVIAKIWPYGIPPQRDRIFGHVIRTHSAHGNKLIKTLNPVRVYKGTEVSPVYSEIAGLYGGVDEIHHSFRGNENINMTKYHADFNWIKDKEDLLKTTAANFKAPGGKKCPIAEGQDFYDFYQQYIATRRVKLDLSHLEALNEEPPEGFTPEQRKEMKAVMEGFGKYLDGKKPMTLEEVLIGFIMSKEYQKIPTNPQQEGAKSYRLKILSNVVGQWREDALDELLGVDNYHDEGLYVIGQKKDGSEMMGFRGVMAHYWPNLARDILAERVAINHDKAKKLPETLRQETQNLQTVPLPELPNDQ